jgi:hypothetical protein
MITGKHLSRRTLLKGIGVSIALPMLDSMLPAFAPQTKAPLRMLFNYVPNGIIMNDWTPTSSGASYDLPRVLEPMAEYRDKMMVITGLMQKSGNANGDGPGDHARAAATYLTGVHAKKTEGADIYVGVSMDQVAAQKVGSATRFPSIELTSGTQPSRGLRTPVRHQRRRSGDAQKTSPLRPQHSRRRHGRYAQSGA